jgi:glycosyltransferase involved in cell wall biosynthesis
MSSWKLHEPATFHSMRIAFISHSASKYGAELALLELLEGLSKSGVRCLVLVPKSGPLLSELDRLNIEWRVLKYPQWISRRKSLYHRTLRTLKGFIAAARMAIILSKWCCDLVYTNTVAISTGALAAWLIRKPHVWHLHESGYRIPLVSFDFGNHWAAHLINRFSAMVIVVSRAVADDYAPYIDRKRMRLIYQSVTPRDEAAGIDALKSAKDSLTCVIVGSLEARKGQDEAIAAVAELIGRGVDIHLLVVGDGPNAYQSKLLKQVQHLNLEHQVKFHGYAENPVPLIQAADLMLVCSSWEPFGRVTIEGMLVGKALIASMTGGTTELIRDGETGLLYPSGDHVALADKIQYLHVNPGVRSALGMTARSWATGRFTRERYTKEVLDLLNEVLSR